MFILVLLIIIACVLWYFSSRGDGSGRVSNAELESQLRARNYEWAQFIARYYAQAKHPGERELVRRMIADIAAKGLPVPTLDTGDEPTDAAPVSTEAEELAAIAAAETWADTATQAAAVSAPKATHQQQLDSASLLLYFGAFLFVASAGLFVAFGGLPGSLRTAIVFLVAVSLYAGGMLLYEKRPALKQAGIAFVGIGMAVAPLVGLAAYNFIFDKSNGNSAWLLTSLFCLGLYTHALLRLRQPLLAYIFIFTLLSLFESSISMLNVPLYYFGWAMALMGILITLYARLKGSMDELRDPARTSGMLFIPIAVFVSLVLVGSQGAGQLGVSLLIAALYYLIESISSDGEEQVAYGLVAQFATLAGVGALTFAATDSWPAVTVVLSGAALIEAAILLVLPAQAALSRDIASVALVVQGTAALIAWSDARVAFGALAVASLLGLCMAWRQKRDEGYVVMWGIWMALPSMYGYLVAVPRLSHQMIAMLVLGVLALQYAVLVALAVRSKHTLHSSSVQSATYLVTAIVPCAMSFIAGSWWCFGVSVIVSLSFVSLLRVFRDHSFAIVAGLYACFPLLLGFGDGVASGEFLASTAYAFVLNVGLSLVYRQEATRWFSTALWLLLPVAIGNNAFDQHWGPIQYTIAYVVAMLGLILSRAVARGVVMPSSTVPMASYARTASVSYVVGYVIAACVALGASCAVERPDIATTAVLGGLLVVVFVLAEYIEKQAALLFLLPIIGQLTLLSAIRPADEGQDMLLWLLFSCILPVLWYIGVELVPMAQEKRKYVRYGALVAICFVPATRLFTEHSYWGMPIGLLVASAMLFDFFRDVSQGVRELIGGLALLGVYWCMALAGVENVQAYSHVLVALFAGYAYWRHVRGEENQCDQYIIAALAVATGPLLIQALNGAAGGLYGWWLLIEQVVILVMGILLNKRVMIYWGLYVSVGAVLYQLRHLGWAALTLLALFIIGLAVYRIQKISQKP